MQTTKMIVIISRSQIELDGPEGKVYTLCSGESVVIRTVTTAGIIERLLYARHYSKCFTDTVQPHIV